MQSYLFSLLGGALIGLAISLMLYLNGRVTGVSGIISGALSRSNGDLSWRINFILGLILGGFALKYFYPQAFATDLQRSLPWLIIAGILVGFGTVMGGGCTSGHGICGLSRFSRRSQVATMVFMIFGIISATGFRLLLGGG